MRYGRDGNLRHSIFEVVIRQTITITAILIAVLMPVYIFSQSVDSLIDAARKEMLKDPKAARDILEPALERSIKDQHYHDVVPLLHQMGILAIIEGDVVKKISFNKEALNYARLSGNKLLIANSLTKLAKDYRNSGKPDSATSLCLDAISHYQSISEEGNAWTCYVILGNVAYDATQLEDAELYYLKAWEVVQSLEDSKDELIVAAILQNFYIATRNEVKYTEILEKLLRQNPYFAHELDEGNAHYYSLLRVFNASAESYGDLQKSISIHRKMNQPLSLKFAMARLGNILTMDGRYAEGFDTLKSALQLATYSLPSQMILYYQLFANRRGAGDLKTALDYYEKYNKTKDSINTERATAHIRELEVSFETKEKELALLKERERTKQRTMQRNIMFGAAGVIIWFSLFGILFFWNRARFQKQISIQSDAISQQKIQQLEQEKKLLAMSSMIGGQEAERKRIAQDLHDGLGGLLSSVKAQLNLIQHQVNKLASGEMYTKANTLIDTASSELRRIAYNMMPSSLSRLGLEAALEDLAASLEADHSLKVNLQILGLNTRLEETTEIMIYRIIQELSNNVVKHAGATRLLIQINKTEEEIFLVVEDNGIGLDPEILIQSRGIGMKSIESRVKYLNGTMDISGGKGTCVSVHIPL